MDDVTISVDCVPRELVGLLSADVGFDGLAVVAGVVWTALERVVEAAAAEELEGTEVEGFSAGDELCSRSVMAVGRY